MKRNLAFLVVSLVGLGLLGVTDPAQAHANWRVNGIGHGTCGAGVTAARGGAASSVGFTGFNSECCVPGGAGAAYVPCTNTAPLPGGANAGTFAGSWFRSLWRGAFRGRSVGGDGWGTTTVTDPACSGGDADGSFSLTVTGGIYTLDGSWNNTNPMAVGTVCIECGGTVIHCTQQSGVWSGSVHDTGVLCPAQPASGQTEDDWYAQNVYLTGNLDAPANSKCVTTKLP